MNQGFSKVYQKYLLNSMKHNLLQKMQKIDYRGILQISQHDIQGIHTFRDFDDKVTAPLHGYQDADDYYEKCSAFYFLKGIHCPTLILHALDDPFMNENVVPGEQDLSSAVTLELSEHGGHVGFMQGTPVKPVIWMHERVKRFFADYLPLQAAL